MLSVAIGLIELRIISKLSVSSYYLIICRLWFFLQLLFFSFSVVHFEEVGRRVGIKKKGIGLIGHNISDFPWFCERSFEY
jgi:hypothetical protein